jgi:iron(III) transport system ATP-binding protein
MGSAVELNRISKSFGAIKVLDEIDLTVPEGSFTSLLGPSGCGKTTLLNIIGGLERPSGGRISFGEEVMYSEQDAVDVPTERRNIGFVFQSYALWPHMTVVQNVAYPLRIRGIDTRERERRAKDMLGKLELGGLADRYPFQLSGGQQQRVAIARSLVYQPRILLLDEPLSNLDAQLRERARVWLKTVHETFGLTIILVTHDQSEALSLSDHIVLLSKGRIEQQGPALEIYEAPHTAYAAEFVGGANVLLGRLDNAGIALIADSGVMVRMDGKPGSPGASAGVAIRPQSISFCNPDVGQAGTVLPFEVETTLYLGGIFEVLGRTPVGNIRLHSKVPPTGREQHILLPSHACIRVAP